MSKPVSLARTYVDSPAWPVRRNNVANVRTSKTRRQSVVPVDLCAKAVEDAWNDPEFLAEQRRVCGDTKEYVFPYKRKSGNVKDHYRNLHAPRPRARKPKADPREKEATGQTHTEA
eukprot:COSAG02_NODE_20_length_53673_cov_86.864841_25_plen_116_part_00